MILNSPTISGSLTVTGNIIASGSITLSGSVASASFASTASFVALAQSASNAVAAATASFANAFTVASTLTAQTLVVQTITSSVDFVTGSTRFGSVIGNTHVFTGSISASGSFNIIGTSPSMTLSSSGAGAVAQFSNISGSTFIGVDNLGGYFTPTQKGTAIYDGSGTRYLYVTSSGVGIGTTNPSQLLEVVGGEIKAGRVDSSNEGGQVSFGRSTDNATAWYIDAYGNVASPQLRFVNVTNAVVAMTITGSNVGIGTSSPNGNLEVYAATPIIISGASSSGTLHGLEFRQSNTIDAYIKQLPATGEFRFYVGRNSSWGGNMSFWTDTVQRMTITSGGNVEMYGNTLVKAASLTVGNNAAAGVTNITLQNNQNGYQFGINAACTLFQFSNGAPSVVATINGGSGAYTALSDINKKKDFEESTIGLNEVLQLKPTLFRFKDAEEGSQKELGFIAQEVKEIIPQAYVEHDEFIGLSYNPIIAVLTKAIQELKTQNDDLQSQINELKAQ